MKIAKTARPRMRPPLPFSKEKAESSSSVISVPATIARPRPAASRISTSTLRSEWRRADRVGDQRRARRSARRCAARSARRGRCLL